MTKPAVEYPDVERLAIDLVDSLTTHNVGTILPADWSHRNDPPSPTFVQVQWDGTPIVQHPVMAHATIRVTVYASSPTVAKGVANRVMGLLLAHDGSGGISAVLSLTGVLPTQDPDTRAPVASFTVRMTTRSAAIV